ncbi:MAG: response regulator [Lachnospiraceae bacterium]|nr:response regulator [Lachnospiraceae bacterium]
MKTVIDILLFLSLFNCIYVIIIMTKTNIKFRERMALGGKKFLIITDICYVFTVLFSVLVLLIFVLDVFCVISIEIISAVTVLAASLSMWFLLLIRGLQNKGIDVMFNRGNAMRDTRNRLMVSVSHEIRTPMNSIIGLSEVILRRDDIPDDVREDIDNISVASSLLLGVVNNLIDFTKVESGQIEIIESEYNTRGFIDEIIHRAGNMLKGSQVEFLTDIDAGLPLRLIGDEVRLVQAIANIISNASKYTHVGVITFRILCIRERNIAKLTFIIEDTGIGMNKGQREKFLGYSNDELIRDPMSGELKGTSSLGSASDDDGNKSIGLGLIITRAIIEKLGGRMYFKSEEGSGTSVTIEVDQKIAVDTPIGDFSLMHKETKKHYMFSAPMARVLVVDDNVVNLFVSKELLLNYEIDVTTAGSGAECLALVNNNYYDLIFMDYVMPEMDGHETLKKLRKRENEFARKIPVVALTAMVTSGGSKMYIDEGFQGYLSKPINVHDLEEQLLRLLPDKYIVRKNVPEEVDEEPIEQKLWYKRISNILTDVDIKQGLLYSNNDYMSYLNLLRVIYNDSYTQIAKLNRFKEKIDIDDFRVTIHALKSVTASVGAEELSSICKDLEMHAKDGDAVYIRDNIDNFIDRFDAFLRKIDTLLARENEMMVRGFNKPKITRPEEEISAIVEDLIISLEEFNADDAEFALKKLSGTNLDYDKTKVVETASEMLALFKYDEVKSLIENAFGKAKHL